MLLAAFTGHTVFEWYEREDVVAQFIWITATPIPDLRELGVSSDVAEFVGRAHQEDFEKNFASGVRTRIDSASAERRRSWPSVCAGWRSSWPRASPTGRSPHAW
ncbi:hypothetical protein ACWDUM_23335 [Rhodococcus sp. NPDC003322]